MRLRPSPADQRRGEVATVLPVRNNIVKAQLRPLPPFIPVDIHPSPSCKSRELALKLALNTAGDLFNQFVFCFCTYVAQELIKERVGNEGFLICRIEFGS